MAHVGRVAGEPYKFRATGPEALFLAFSDGLILETTDGGATWRTRSGHETPLRAGGVTALAARPGARRGRSALAGAVTDGELVYLSADATSLNTLTRPRPGGEIEFRDPTVDGGADPGPCRPGDVDDDGNGTSSRRSARRGVTRVRVDLADREDTATVALNVPVSCWRRRRRRLTGGAAPTRVTAATATTACVGGGDDV